MDQTKSVWKCTSCQQTFELTLDEELIAINKAQGVPIHCAKCAKKEAYKLIACMTCGTLFFSPNVPGESGQCPQCPPSAQPFPEPAAPEPGQDPIEFDAPHKRQRPKSA